MIAHDEDRQTLAAPLPGPSPPEAAGIEAGPRSRRRLLLPYALLAPAAAFLLVVHFIAAATAVCVPPALIFPFLQRQMVSGLTAGAVK